MNAFTRMMEDYDYHRNAGKLPGFFGGGNNGCFMIFVIVIILVITIWVASGSCSDNREKKAQQEQTPLVSSPTPVYEQPLYYPPVAPADTPQSESVQTQSQEKAISTVSPPVQPTVTVSKYYEKGYDVGYDDGEDDAVMDNGWGGQFDDSCPYKGKARKDYQLGYEEGYEAGYYDNKDSDE